MLPSATKIEVFPDDGLEVNEDIIFLILAMFRKFKTQDQNLSVPQSTLPVPLFSDRVFFRPLRSSHMQKEFVKYQSIQKSKGMKCSLKKLPLPDKVQYLVLKGRWSPIFKIAMCLSG
ncbi:hypothetical protein KR200_008461 [Drosophila serrata]|nr:hypothetical protein KR200_008461 [Drosophila serrata]